jgi:hypothetical protein
MSHPLHDEILDHADALLDVAEKEMAELFAAGETERATCWVELAQHVAAGVRAIGHELHPCTEDPGGG